eukprot:scaffold12311_cov56-Phaeocystis_antarctica.AAC.3
MCGVERVPGAGHLGLRRIDRWVSEPSCRVPTPPIRARVLLLALANEQALRLHQVPGRLRRLAVPRLTVGVVHEQMVGLRRVRLHITQVVFGDLSGMGAVNKQHRAAKRRDGRHSHLRIAPVHVQPPPKVRIEAVRHGLPGPAIAIPVVAKVKRMHHDAGVGGEREQGRVTSVEANLAVARPVRHSARQVAQVLLLLRICTRGALRRSCYDVAVEVPHVGAPHWRRWLLCHEDVELFVRGLAPSRRRASRPRGGQ